MDANNTLPYYDRKVEQATQYAKKAEKFYVQALTNVIAKHPEIEGQVRKEVDRLIKEQDEKNALRTQKRKAKKATEEQNATT